MICRKCKSPNTYVIDSREKGNVRRRRYRCDVCGERFFTLESYETDALFKSDSAFSKEQIEETLERATKGAEDLLSIIKQMGYRRTNDWKE